MEREADSSCSSHINPECMARMECRGCGAMPRRGLLLTIPRTDSLRGYEGRDYGRKCMWRKASQPWKEGNTVGSCVGGGAITSSVQFSSVARPCLILCDPMNHSMPDLPVHHQLPEFTQTHVHLVGDAIQPSYPLSSPSPAPNPSQHQGLFQ